MRLDVAEWLSLLVFSWYVILAWSRRSLDPARRARITAIGVASLAGTLFAALVLPQLVPPLAGRVTRDWLPLILLLLSYWQAGQFVTRADAGLENRLERLDCRIVAPPLEWCLRHPAGIWILTYGELAYMSYYVALPLSIAALYLTGGSRDAGRFWTIVLLAAYGSCGTLPFLQTRPPRALGEKWSAALPSTKVRSFNLWILRGGSIQANTFPSAHVAIATACALALLQLAPLWVGLVFLWIAISIAFGAVAGRYHYAADAILGFAVALVAFPVGLALAPAGFAG